MKNVDCKKDSFEIYPHVHTQPEWDRLFVAAYHPANQFMTGLVILRMCTAHFCRLIFTQLINE